jgi:hypothetical protein
MVPAVLVRGHRRDHFVFQFTALRILAIESLKSTGWRLKCRLTVDFQTSHPALKNLFLIWFWPKKENSHARTHLSVNNSSPSIERFPVLLYAHLYHRIKLKWFWDLNETAVCANLSGVACQFCSSKGLENFDFRDQMVARDRSSLDESVAGSLRVA